uniref:Ankyrin repeat and SOCS box containing 2 n=1 Tax=Latimeria chalumnae TaxID=7897 RepID=H3A1L4_LATCH
MATGAATRRVQGATLGHEEYSLYSSLTEDELIQMAIEQSLTETSAGQTAAPNLHKSPTTGKTAVAPNKSNRSLTFVSCHPKRVALKNAVKPLWEPKKQQVRRRRYDGSYFYVPPQPVVIDPVVQAIKNGDEATLAKMIKSGRNLSEPNKDGWLPLHEAAYFGQLGCIKLLIKAFPATIDQRTLQEETALYLVTLQGFIDCVCFLLQSGAEPDIANKSKDTPLYKACERKYVEAVKLLVQYNADVNHRCNQGWTALHETVARSDLEAMDVLVKAGANVEARNIYGVTPLFVAAQSGQCDALRYLVKCGAEINTQASDSATALYEACKNGHEEVMLFLLSQGADANKTNKNGLLPLHIAAKTGNEEIVSALIPVTSRARVKRSGISPLHLAAERNRDEVLELLIDAGYDVNSTLSYDRAGLYEDRRSTPLYFAVCNNNIYATELLLKAGANPNVDIINPLLISIRQGCLTSMKLLLNYGANINAYISLNPTTFPATIMFSMRYVRLLKFLMDLGCDAEPCFMCEYGSGPHPVEEVRTNRDEEQRQRYKQQKIVQFCEMISTPKISRWAGPIIDVLLDYVGNVQLCAKLKEHLDGFEEWAEVKQKAEPPRSLLHFCRLKVRKSLGQDRIKYIEKLPLPYRLIRYLQYKSST